MKYRRFGRTNLSMPVFSCGGMRYQQAWTDLDPDKVEKANQANLEATIHRSLELGINHIETARGYGSSEMQLGWLLPKLPREKLIIQTKVAPTADPQEFLATFEKSLEYLQLDHVDLLSMHGINNAELLDFSVRPGGCLEIARQLQREGRVRFVGFSTHATLPVILRTIETNEFDYVNLHWYYVNPHNWPAVEAATQRDMGVFIISPNDKGGKLYEPPAKLVDLCAPLSPMVWNNLYCLARPEVHTLSLGAARPSDFDEHMKIFAHYDQAQQITAPITARIDAAVEQAVGAEWYRGYLEGVPEYDAVPGEINIREIMRLWTYAHSLDLIDWGKMRYNLMGQAGHWFPGLKTGELDEAQLRSVLQDSPFADRIIEVLREAHTLLEGEPKKRLSQSD